MSETEPAVTGEQPKEEKKEKREKRTGPHVLAAINTVKRALAKHGGITKDRDAPAAAGGYAFRGIDDMYNVLCSLTAEAGLVMLPKVLDRSITFHEKKEKIQTHVQVQMAVTFESEIDGSMREVVTIGEALDSSDKASNKAMSAAMKYACLMPFMIPTHGESDDTEAYNEPRQGTPQPKKTAVQGTFSKGPVQAGVDEEPPPPEVSVDQDELAHAYTHIEKIIRNAKEARTIVDVIPDVDKMPEIERIALRKTAEVMAERFIKNAQEPEVLREARDLVAWLGTKTLKAQYNQASAQFRGPVNGETQS